MSKLGEYDVEIRVNAVIQVSIKAESLEDAAQKANELNQQDKLWGFKSGITFHDGKDWVITVREANSWDNLYD